MSSESALAPKPIESQIFLIRGQKVILERPKLTRTPLS